MIHHTICAIIPAYNEEKNIARVIQVLQQSPLLSEIIVVNDGSHDGTASVAASHGVLVITLEKNQGKAHAMAAGAQSTSADILFFVDADLIGLTPDHVATVITPVTNGDAGMTVGLRDRGPWMWWLLEHALPVIGGERAILRTHFLTIAAYRAAKRFGIETVMNAYCARNHIPVILVRMQGVTLVRKEQKVGLIKGLFQRIAMFGQILRTEIVLLFERNE